ncbi:MAG: preprotein translocase subunit YajC, partial [Thermoanaerobaculia bacterium]
AFQGQPPGQSPWLGLVPMVAIFAIFYLLLVAPMRKKQRALAQTIAGLKRGDKVVTNGGLYGEVAGIEGNVILLKVADNVRLRVAKSAIAGLEERDKEVSS